MPFQIINKPTLVSDKLTCVGEPMIQANTYVLDLIGWLTDFLDVISKTQKIAMEVNPDRKLGVDPRKRSAVNPDKFAGTPTDKAPLNAMPFIPFDFDSKAKSGM